MAKNIKLDRANVYIDLIKRPNPNAIPDAIWNYLNEYKHNVERTPQPQEDRREAGSGLRYARETLKKQTPIYRYYIVIILNDKKYKKFQLEHQINFLEGRDTWREVIPKLIDETIRQFRRQIKREPIREDLLIDTVVKFLGNKKGGRVFAEPQQVLKAYVDKNIKGLYQEKRPEVINRYVGIELEFCAPITESNLALLLFKAGIHKFAQLKQDGSLRPKKGETAFELALLLRESTFKKDLRKVCNLLESVKAMAVDRRCGLHVHLDMRRRNKDLVYNNLVACQDFLLKLVDPSRIDNEFCRIVNSRKMPIEVTGQRTERYKTINAIAYYKYKTLEVRMHEGSVNFKQISNWVDILIKIANHKTKLKDNINSLTVFQKRFKLDKKLNDYAVERSCTLRLNNPQRQQSQLARTIEETLGVRITVPNTEPEPNVEFYEESVETAPNF